MLEAYAKVFIQATQPRTAHTAVDAMECSGLSGIDELAARLGHGRSLGARALRENRIGRNLGSDLSEGCPRAVAVAVANLKKVRLKLEPLINRLLGIAENKNEQSYERFNSYACRRS